RKSQNSAADTGQDDHSFGHALPPRTRCPQRPHQHRGSQSKRGPIALGAPLLQDLPHGFEFFRRPARWISALVGLTNLRRGLGLQVFPDRSNNRLVHARRSKEVSAAEPWFIKYSAA